MKEDWPGNSPDVNTEENILDDKLYADREIVKMEQTTITDTESYQLHDPKKVNCTTLRKSTESWIS